MSPSPELAATHTENAQPNPRGGPRTEAGKSASSRNAITHGLFTQRDFIRPGEEEDYMNDRADLSEALAPAGPLECNLVDEIHRAMWRLRRCGEVEASFLPTLGAQEAAAIPDPIQRESTAKLQLSVDRARNQAHRLLHKCTAELRKLQTERQFRNEYFKAGTDLSDLGLADLASITRNIDAREAATWRNQKAELAVYCAQPAPPPAPDRSSFCKTTPAPAQTPRNAECPCKSGLKFKRCCGRNAPAVLHAA